MTKNTTLRCVSVLVCLILMAAGGYALETPTGCVVQQIDYRAGTTLTAEQVAQAIADQDALIAAEGLTVTVLQDPEGEYNCHGYSYVMANGGDPIILEYDDAYYAWNTTGTDYTDCTATYTSTSSSSAACVIRYTQWHSGLIQSGGDIISKWGTWSLIQHAETEVPAIYGSVEGYYKNVIAASAVHAFNVCNGTASWDVSRLDEAESFFVDGFDGREWRRVAEVPADRAGKYELPVGGFYGLYRLGEADSAGWETIQESAAPTTRIVQIPSPRSTEQDERIRADASVNQPAIADKGTLIPVVVLYPPEFESTMMAGAPTYAELKAQQGFGVIYETTAGMSSNPTVKRDQIKALFQSHASNGVKLFQLIGDANDYVQFAQTVWPGSWRSIQLGYLASGYPSSGQPGYDLIPTWYEWVPSDSNPNHTMEYVTPYRMMDYKYIDFDDDGLPDEGFAIARYPANQAWQVLRFRYKLTGYHNAINGYEQLRVAMLVGDQNHEGPGSGDVSVAIGEEILDTINVSKTSFTHYESEAATQGDLNTLLVSDWTAEQWDLMHVVGTWSTRYRPGYFMDVTTGTSPFDVGDLPTYSFPFMLASTCDVMDFARTEHGSYGRPVIDRLLHDDIQRGIIGAIGPTVGTVQTGNSAIGQALMEEISASNWALPSLRAHAALREVMSRYEPGSDEYRMAQSTVFLMDVCMRFPWQRAPKPNDPGPDPHEAMPNPANPGTTLRFEVGSPCEARIGVYDLAGRRVRSARVHCVQAGTHEFFWDGCDNGGLRLSSGVYLYRITTGGNSVTGKIAIVK